MEMESNSIGIDPVKSGRKPRRENSRCSPIRWISINCGKRPKKRGSPHKSGLAPVIMGALRALEGYDDRNEEIWRAFSARNSIPTSRRMTGREQQGNFGLWRLAVFAAA